MARTSETGNKAAVRRFYDATNTHDADAISKTTDDIFHPDVVLHNQVATDATGAQAVKEVFAQLDSVFPDLHVTIDDLIEEGDKVVTRSTVTGTNQGAFLGRPPTGKPVTYDEIFICRFANGRIAEMWGVVNTLSVMQQLGAIAG